MEDSSFLHQSKEALRFPVKGMESVIATVSGYQGSERFNLIKLISKTGASYVGAMNQSVTHLVCWNFEGRKYELGKKLQTVIIVNHYWIEDCVRKGRRVPEHPYTFQCGKEMGPPLLKIPLEFNKASSQTKPWKNAKRHLINIEDEDTDDDFVIDTSLLYQDLPSEVRQSNQGSKRPKRKIIKQSSVRGSFKSDSYYLDELLMSGPMMEPAEPSSSKQALSLNKGLPTSLEPCRDRRLDKKQRSIEDSGFAGDFGKDCQREQSFPENNGSGASHDNSYVQMGEDELGNAFDQSRFWSQQIDTETFNGAEEIDDINDDDDQQNLCAENAPPLVHNTVDDCTVVHEVLDDTDLSTRLHQSSELSCVICWTDFSSTRGVLPCGHRFCFSCIQTWADHMASRGKASKCPLCKSSFMSITKVEDAVSSDQKIYSQTIPHDRAKVDAYILLNDVHTLPANQSVTPVCYRCFSREPEDLLVRCQLCQIQCVHTYCLDPPLFPWTCAHCKDLQMLYLQTR